MHIEVTNIMPTVYTTLDYEYRHKNKVLVWFWYLGSVGCTNETKKATRSVQYRLILQVY